MNKTICPFCRGEQVTTDDTEKFRTHTCRQCGSVQSITKGTTSWWYHGWTAKDGRKMRAPTSDEMTRGIYGWQPA